MCLNGMASFGSLNLVASSLAAAALGTVLWLRRNVIMRGTLGPRCAADAKMFGWREHIGCAMTHYAIFSKEGEWGRGQIDPQRLLVYIHGLGAHLGQLTWGVDGGLAQALVDAGYTVLGIDLYGHGFSDAPDLPMKPDEMVEHVKLILEHLEVTAPFDLMGFSHGCFISAALAASQPARVKRLVFVSPFGADLPCHSWRVVAGFATLMVHLFFEGNMSRMRTIYRIFRRLEGHRFASFLKKIDAEPISVFIDAGSWDCDPALRIVQTARRMHSELARSKLHVTPGGTHMTWATGSPTQQRSFRERVLSFLADAGGCAENGGPDTPLLRTKL